jgi:hypothetical protein
MPALTDNDSNAMNLSGSQPPTSVLAPDGSQAGKIDRITELQDGVGTLPNLALLRLRPYTWVLTGENIQISFSQTGGHSSSHHKSASDIF